MAARTLRTAICDRCVCWQLMQGVLTGVIIVRPPRAQVGCFNTIDTMASLLCTVSLHTFLLPDVFYQLPQKSEDLIFNSLSCALLLWSENYSDVGKWGIQFLFSHARRRWTFTTLFQSQDSNACCVRPCPGRVNSLKIPRWAQLNSCSIAVFIISLFIYQVLCHFCPARRKHPGLST